ncbi:hypothetical protein GCM10009534_21190 [Kribbella sandramycini]
MPSVFYPAPTNPRPADESAGRDHPTTNCLLGESGDADEFSGGGGEFGEEGEEVGGGVGEAEEAGFVVAPAEEEFAVEGVVREGVGVAAEGDAVGARLGVVVAAAAFGGDGDGGEGAGGVAGEAEGGAAGGEVADGGVGELDEELDRDGVRAGQQAEAVGREKIGKGRKIHQS